MNSANFLNNSRGYRSLSIKTRLLRQIAPESSPERSAKSLSQNFFGGGGYLFCPWLGFFMCRSDIVLSSYTSECRPTLCNYGSCFWTCSSATQSVPVTPVPNTSPKSMSRKRESPLVYPYPKNTRNSDHGLSFPSPETQTMVWVSPFPSKFRFWGGLSFGPSFSRTKTLSFLPRGQKHWGRGRRMSIENGRCMSHGWQVSVIQIGGVCRFPK